MQEANNSSVEKFNWNCFSDRSIYEIFVSLDYEDSKKLK